MRILVLDTALGATSVSVVDFPAATEVAGETEPMQRGHAEALIPMVDRVMGRVEGGFSSIDRIATTVGPGSFTGLRVALAAARSFALALGIPVVGVSTLAAYAAPLLAAGGRSIVAAAIDARHGAVFFESFWLDGRKALGPLVLGVDEAVTALSAGKARVTGTGAAALAAAAAARGLAVECVEAGLAPDIAWVARLGAAADPMLAPPRPLYLKPASALPQAGARIASV
jgi:tRNA threonylcarbamoyl adenosine modification protein YeaZ